MILFYFLILIMPLTRHPLWSRLMGEMTVFKYVGGVCVIYAVFYLLGRREPPPFLHSQPARLFLLLYLIATASYFTKSMPGQWDFSPFLSYTSFLLLFFITLTTVDTVPRLRSMLMVCIGSAAFASLYVVREWQREHNLYADFRPGWVVGDSNNFAITALVCLPVAFYLMLEGSILWRRLFSAGCLAVTLVAVTLGASRGGFLGLLAGFLYLVLRSRRRMRNLILVSALVIPAVLLLPTSPLHRFLHPTWIDTASVESRTVAWDGGLRMIAAHPLFGVGLGNFKPLVTQYEKSDIKVQSIAHNTYIEVGAELGLPALLVFLALLVSSFRHLEKVRRQAKRSEVRLVEFVALAMEGQLVAYCGAAFFLSAQYEKFFWLMLFLSMCLPSLVGQVTAERKNAREALRAIPAWQGQS
jgi:O-antigen ligase